MVAELGDVGQFAPKFIIHIEGKQISEEVTKFIESVEFESVDGMMDEVKLKIVNPRSIIDHAVPFLWTDRKVFYPGNQLDLYMGYKPPLRHMARVTLVEPTFSFPASGTPTITIRGLSPEYVLTVNAPSAERHRAGEKKKRKKKQKTVARLLPGTPNIGDILRNKLSTGAYQFDTIIDDTPGNLGRKAFQRVGMSDYDLIKGLANITGFLFWCDHFKSHKPGSFSSTPILHFRDPNTFQFSEGKGIQEKRATFAYAQNERSTLLSFQPTFTIQGHANKMIASVQLRSGEVVEQQVTAKFDDGTDGIRAQFDGDIAEDKVAKGLEMSDQIKVTINDFSIDLVSVGNKFEDPALLASWLEQWFERRREQFIQARATTIGVETLMARQVHRFVGFGLTFDGDYYVPRVRHIMSQSGGYICDMNLRKIIGFPPLSETIIRTPDPVPDEAVDAVLDLREQTIFEPADEPPLLEPSG